MVRASASQPEGRGFEQWLRHTKGIKSGTHCLLLWCLMYENGVGQLHMQSYLWTSPPAVAFTAFADVWPRATGNGIGATICAIGVGGMLDFFDTIVKNFRGSFPYSVYIRGIMLTGI